MTVPIWVRQAAVILASTAAGYSLGYGILYAFGRVIDRYLAATVQSSGADLGGVLISAGHNLGQIALVVLAAGVLMTATVLCGLVLGLALSQRLVNNKENDTEGETQTR